MLFHSQIYMCTREIPDLVYHPVQWCCQPYGLNWAYLGFCLPHMWKRTQAKCIHDLCVLCGVSCVFIFMLRLQYVCTGKSQLFWQREKPEYPQFVPHAGIKMVQVLESLLYINDSTWNQYTIRHENFQEKAGIFFGSKFIHFPSFSWCFVPFWQDFLLFC